MMALSSPLSRECAANRHQLFDNLAFTRLAVVNPWLAIQRERCTAKRTALAGFKEMPPQGINSPRIATIAGSGFSLKLSDCGIRPFNEPAHGKQHVIRVLWLLATGKRIQLQHKQCAHACYWHSRFMLYTK
jgi:hypothetical protein